MKKKYILSEIQYNNILLACMNGKQVHGEEFYDVILNNLNQADTITSGTLDEILGADENVGSI